jgi:peptidoglycan/LPS O-acetylase OafA/YrhL
VLAVVAYHLGTTGDGGDILRGGFLGVDVFFVLSGYLITSLLMVEAQRTGRISIRQFYIRRARRLLPALYALLLVVGAIGAIWLPQQAAKMRGDLVSALTYVTNWWLVFENSSYFGGGDRPRLLTHLWSLAVEEQFYLVWPIVLIVFARIRAARGLMLTALLLGAGVSAVAAAALYDPWVDPSRVYYGTDTRAVAPLLGAALAIAIRPWRHREGVAGWRRSGLDAIGLVSLAGLGAVAVLLADTNPLLYRGGFALIAVLAAGLVGVAGHPATLLGRALGWLPLRWLGERSYAIYLWHWPVCVLTRPTVDIPITGWVNAVLRVGLSVVLADLSYRFVERPIRSGTFFNRGKSHHTAAVSWLRRPVPRAATLSVAILISATGIGFQLNAAAARPVSGAPVDRGPAATLGLGAPSPSVSAAASPKPHRTGSDVPRLVVFGDSQGMTLLINKPADLGTYFTATDATIEGCGVFVGKVASRSGERRDLAGCEDWASKWAASAAKLHPEIALVMIGAWEVFDLTTPSGTLAFGSPEWDAYLTGAIGTAISTLKAAGATVALSLLPCYRPVKASAGFWPERGDDNRTRHINELLRRAADTDRGHVFAIEPPQEFCTDPAIATSLNYRWDGVHYYKPGSALYFRAVVPQLINLL